MKKNPFTLFSLAAGRLICADPGPARFVERTKTDPGNYHAWAGADIGRFPVQHPAGSKARLVMLLAFSSGTVRQDLCRVGWQHVSQKGDRAQVACKRDKASVATGPPILSGRVEELAGLSKSRRLFIIQDA